MHRGMESRSSPARACVAMEMLKPIPPISSDGRRSAAVTWRAAPVGSNRCFESAARLPAQERLPADAMGFLAGEPGARRLKGAFSQDVFTPTRL
jgi:hypothetical protein